MEPEISTTQENEVWKPVKEYEGIYEVSDHARVRSLDHVACCKHKNGKSYYRMIKGHIAKQHINNKGYVYVALNIDGQRKNAPVHRLVAQAFVPNPYELPVINHKDDNPKNNLPDNLEWCTQQYNIEYRDERFRPYLKQIAGAERVRAATVAELIRRLKELDQTRSVWLIKDGVVVCDSVITKATKDDARKYQVMGNDDVGALVLENDYIINV